MGEVKYYINNGGKESEITLLYENEQVYFLKKKKKTLLDFKRLSSSSKFSLLMGGKSYNPHIENDGDSVVVTVAGQRFEFQVYDQLQKRLGQLDNAGKKKSGVQTVKAVMPGVVTRLLVEEGAAVEKATVLLALEAMKMENEISSPAEGIVQKIFVSQGQTVATGEKLLDIKL